MVAIRPFKNIMSIKDIFRILVIRKSDYMPSNFSKFKDFNVVILFFKSIVDYTCNYFKALNMIVKALRCHALSQIITDISYIIFNKYNLFNNLLNRTIYNYYISDSFSRNSKVMTTCATKIQFLNYPSIRLGIYKSRF